MTGYIIRPREVPADDRALLDIEKRATELFRPYGYDFVADAPYRTVEWLRGVMSCQDVWVALTTGGTPVGFAMAAPLAGYFHLKELSVDPEHGQRGIGSALVQSVVSAAEAKGLAGVTLTTFRDVPFNAPFYARRGFVEPSPDEAPEPLIDLVAKEAPEGVALESRVLMWKPV